MCLSYTSLRSCKIHRIVEDKEIRFNFMNHRSPRRIILEFRKKKIMISEDYVP